MQADRMRAPTVLLREILEISEEFERRLGRHLAVNPTDLSAMEHLIASGPLSPGELARRLGISPAAVTTVIDRLTAAGHAARTPNPDDRRGVLVAAAPDSVAAAMAQLMPMIGDIDRVIDEFDEQESAAIERYLRRVVERYRAHVDD
ncbi:DNA-binding MarR family transcriptional regulator [Diaminobutyricimonas aerilata]|uniref:DNA-binding MarR family transcriptional regulator n=1 Tax=Diaminobutyricimonas aerilata TaxID=1162967 RepID=A0A2M9CL23_9MICO|nr:MarR family transcriptional regulator [Diaminobutyricimonas aerilata]PJJ72582.1 DNA-binding MarR family transcriptional regulator [Diaminobutyricimonas aerilata]